MILRSSFFTLHFLLNLRQNDLPSWQPGAQFCIFALWPVKKRWERNGTRMKRKGKTKSEERRTKSEESNSDELQASSVDGTQMKRKERISTKKGQRLMRWDVDALKGWNVDALREAKPSAIAISHSSRFMLSLSFWAELVYRVEGMTEHRKSEIVTSDELRVQKPLSKKACHNSLFRRRWRV